MKEYKVRTEGHDPVDWQMESRDRERWQIRDGAQEYDVRILKRNPGGVQFLLNGKVFHVTRHDEPDVYCVGFRRVNTVIRTGAEMLKEQLQKQADVGSGDVNIHLSMPGMVISLLVQPGDMVNKGDGVAIVEAMKMENVIKSPAAGVVGKINVSEGMALEKGTVILNLTSPPQTDE